MTSQKAEESLKRTFLSAYDDLLDSSPTKKAIHLLFDMETAYLSPLLGEKPSIISEVKLGSRFLWDFASFRTSLPERRLHVSFVCLDSPDNVLFTSSGDLSQAFIKSLRHVNECVAWCKNHKNHLRRNYFPNHPDVHDMKIEGFLVIGRKQNFPQDNLSLLRQMQKQLVSIYTYDCIKHLLESDSEWFKFI